MNLLIIIGIISFLYLLKPTIKKGIEWFLSRFSDIPMISGGKIFQVFVRESILNWYIYLVLILIWFLLFLTAVGNDMIDSYLSKIKELDWEMGFMPYLSTFGSFLSLFFCLLLMSLTIWTLPFFMYSAEKIEEIQKPENFKNFYLSTKIRAFMAMLPFLIVSNAFLAFSREPDSSIITILLFNSISFAVFLLLPYLFGLKIPYLPGPKIPFLKFFRKIKNAISVEYISILIKIIILILLLSVLFVSFIKPIVSYPGFNLLSIIIAIYVFISSVIVFKLLFYSNESGEEGIKSLVARMLSNENRKNSKKLYLFLFFLLIGVVLYYYFVPSLASTNSLYILLTVFSFYIIYLDYWRNLFNNKKGFWKMAAFFATILVLVLPFISSEKQFTIPLLDTGGNNIPHITLEDRLKQRYDDIMKKDSTGNIFIVCAMGGGSRAGYITASSLKAIDQIDTGFWDNTICYSTVSGGSVGTFSYIMNREITGKNKNTSFLKEIYQRNYNSGGVFGLLIGDALESIFGSILTAPKGWIMREKSPTGFYDRNFRIRREYDYMMQNALSVNPTKDYRILTFFPWTKQAPFTRDTFQAFFKTHPEVPVHLINTFEVNSGRRTVISPFPVRDRDFFPNTILPLQDQKFSCQILNKDIFYRDAVNLSELFPLISAASHIGFEKDAQFVDGGYYENYGLATGLDVFYYLRDSLFISSDRIKLVLIKNSVQQPADAGHQPQLFAPLVGVMQAPFTGHANNLLAQSKRILADSNHIFVIEFDAEKKQVPLTRSLTGRHIDSMNTFTMYILQDKKYRDSLEKFIKH